MPQIYKKKSQCEIKKIKRGGRRYAYKNLRDSSVELYVRNYYYCQQSKEEIL